MRLLAALLLAAAPAAAAPNDQLDGIAVVDTLDAAALSPGAIHRRWFRAGINRIGQAWLVPVIVVRGAKPGPRLVVTAGIHGDELNGIDVIHRLVAGIDPNRLAGTLVAVPGLNTPGLLQGTREFASDASRASANLNRAMPGKPGDGAAEDVAARLWSGLLRPNADTAVDLHTQSRGTAYLLYAFASTPRTRRMAELVGPDVIKLDKGERGTIENELTDAGVPAITFELGAPEVFDPPSVARGVAGLRNLMTELGMLAGSVLAFPAPFVGNDLVNVRAPQGGLATLSVRLGDDVVAGQRLATIADPFGRVVATANAPRAGRVVSIATDPRRETGSLIARIVFRSDDPKCAQGC